MATTFDDDERSASQGRPIDLYTISTPTVVYRLTSHAVDVSFAGSTYTALTMSRGAQQVAQDLTGRELVVYLPITHALVQRFAATGIPEREVLITLVRLQEKSQQAFQQWTGFACGLSIDGHLAAFRVPSATDDAFKIRLPTIRAQKLCNHILYDDRCQISRASFQVPTIISSGSSSTTLVVASMAGHPDAWAAPAGEIVHTTSGERRQIIDQVGTTLTLNAPFATAVNGDAVTVFASCKHDLNDCQVKFNNVVNFGGMPWLNSAANPYVPQGLGVIVQQ